MIDYGHGLVGYVLTFSSLIFGLFTCIVSLVIIIIILHHHHHHQHQHQHQLKREEKITLVLSFHIYFFILMFAIVLISMHIRTLIGDVYGKNFYSSWCVFRGYWMNVSGCVMYCTFVVQAVFRLCRIVYSNYRWLQSYWIFVISAPVLLFGGNVLMFPLLVWHDIVYLPDEHYCYIPSANIRGTLWVIFVCYGVPLICVLLIHIRITVFLRQQPINLAVAIKQRQQRDLLVIQRIFISIATLLATGFPGTVVVFMSFLTGVQVPLNQRISGTAIEVSLAVLSVEMIIMTPQLKKLIMRRWRQNRVATIERMIQMRPVATAQ